jgi:hypothetical protein
LRSSRNDQGAITLFKTADLSHLNSRVVRCSVW